MQNHRPTFEGWLTQPPRNSKPSEGHGSAVRVLRMVNSPAQHMAAEPVPFSPAKPAPVKLRSIKPARHEPAGCGANTKCISHPDCPDTACEGHPDNMGEAKPEDTRALRRVGVALVVFWLVLGVLVLGV